MKRFSTPLASASAALALLFAAIPAQAHGSSAGGFGPGLLHPLTGVDHLLMLVAVGVAAALISPWLLGWALAGALLGGALGAAGHNLPAGELLAALAIAALGVVALGVALRRTSSIPWAALSPAVVALGVGLHAMLHGLEAPNDGGTALWWLGALGASTLLAGSTYFVSQFFIARGSDRWVIGAAGSLTMAGLALAIGSF